MNKFVFFVAALGIFQSCKEGKRDNPATPTPDVVAPSEDLISYSIKGYQPHDIDAFTEGLLFYKGKLYESTGASLDHLPQTRSLFGEVDSATGKITVKAELDKHIYFGEGITFLNGKAYQLTYKNQICFVYDLNNFKEIARFTYENEEGWGLTNNGKEIIMSDGTNKIYFRDPNNFKTLRTIQVFDKNLAIQGLNELEYISGYIYANVWQTSSIVKIDPNSGNVVGKLNLAPIVEAARKKNPYALEMNGIAYDSVSNKILITGKMWSQFVQIDFAH